jgi:hypothetical protein
MNAQGSVVLRAWGARAMPLQSDQRAMVHVVNDDVSMREALQELFHSIGPEARA